MLHRVLPLCLVLVLAALLVSSCGDDPTTAEDPSTVRYSAEPFSRLMDGSVYARDVVETNDGNSVVVGTFDDVMRISETEELRSQHNLGEIFLLAFTPTGEVAWSRGFGAEGALATRIGRDAGDNLYVGGVYGLGNNVVFDTSLPAYGDVDLFITKLDKTGEPLWTIGGGAGEGDHLADMLVTPEGNLFVCGRLASGEATLGGVHFGRGTTFSGYLAAIGPGGSGQWAATIAGGTGYATCHAVAQTDAGNVYVAGDFRAGTVEVGNHVFNNDGNDPSDYDLFVAGYGADGKPVSAIHIGGEGFAYAAGLATLDDGPVVVGNVRTTNDFDTNGPGGETTSQGEVDAFVARYDATGSLLWVKTFGGPDLETALDVCRIGVSDLLVLGTFKSTITLGLEAFISHGAHDYYVVRLNSDGGVVWATQLGGPNDEFLGQIIANGSRWTATGFADWGDFEFPDGTLRLAEGRASFIYQQP